MKIFVLTYTDFGTKLQQNFTNWEERRSDPEEIREITEFLKKERHSLNTTKFWERENQTVEKEKQKLIEEREREEKKVRLEKEKLLETQFLETKESTESEED